MTVTLIDVDLFPLIKAADEGNPNAQRELGSRYFKGNGVPKDEKKAIRTWIKMIENETINPDIPYPSFMYKMGLIYYHSFKNFKAAGYWFSRASFLLIDALPFNDADYYIRDLRLEVCLQETGQFDTLKEIENLRHKAILIPVKNE